MSGDHGFGGEALLDMSCDTWQSQSICSTRLMASRGFFDVVDEGSHGGAVGYDFAAGTKVHRDHRDAGGIGFTASTRP